MIWMSVNRKKHIKECRKDALKTSYVYTKWNIQSKNIQTQ